MVEYLTRYRLRVTRNSECFGTCWSTHDVSNITN